MNIIQFKRKNSQNNTNSPELTAGEMFVFPSEEKIRIGKQEGTSTSAAGTYFEIKAKPNCLYTSTGVAQNTIVGLQSSSSAGKIQYRQMNSDGTLGPWTDLSANVSTNAASADKLNSNAGKDGGSGVMNPIYFGSGVPKAMTGTIGSSTKPVYINNGKITECNTIPNGISVFYTPNVKYYFYGNTMASSTGSQVQSLLTNTNTYIDSTGSFHCGKLAPTINPSSNNITNVLFVNSNGEITKFNNYSNSSGGQVKSDGTTNAITFIAYTGWYVIYYSTDLNDLCTALIYYDSTKTSGYVYSNLSAAHSSIESYGIRIEYKNPNTTSKIYIFKHTENGNSMKTGKIYKVNRIG